MSEELPVIDFDLLAKNKRSDPTPIARTEQSIRQAVRGARFFGHSAEDIAKHDNIPLEVVQAHIRREEYYLYTRPSRQTQERPPNAFERFIGTILFLVAMVAVLIFLFLFPMRAFGTGAVTVILLALIVFALLNKR
jgi:ABC-type transport system involved in cytochrome bd biosynthesis fused ATPase/permease subunit